MPDNEVGNHDYKNNSIEWKKKIDGESGHENFTEDFIEALEYITFDDLLESLEKMAQEIEKLFQSKKYEKITFFVPGTYVKSSAFIFFLLFGKLSEILDEKEDYDNVFDFYSIPHYAYKDYSKFENISKTLCIICDDMSYSGSQLHNQIWRIKDHKYRYEDRYSELCKKLDLYLGVPYIGTSAKNKLKGLGVLEPKYFNTTKEYKSFGELWKGKQKTLEEAKKITDKRIFDLAMIPVYSDIKVPDSISFPYFIVMAGLDPFTLKKVDKIEPLVNNYEVNLNNKIKLHDIIYEHGNIITEEFDKYVSPKAFYKRRNYCKYNNDEKNDLKQGGCNIFKKIAMDKIAETK